MEDDGPRRSVPQARRRIPAARAHPRRRLDERMAPLWGHSFGLVVAPAGSGKTTALIQFASAAEVPVAWYRAEGSEAAGEAFLIGLEEAARAVVDLPPARWASLDNAVAGLEAWPAPGGLLVIDDLHALYGTPAEAALERLIGYLPPRLTVLAASRRAPAFDLSRLRVSGTLFELGPDDLRFRSWEVESLFREFYGEPLPPGDLAELARRTEGWPAGLQLFHLATRGKPPGERRRVLGDLRSRSRLVREYLARNVLGDLPDHLRNFLVVTSTLGQLTGPLCDELLGRRDSESILAELEHRQIFTNLIDDDRTYRYHEVLRCHLEAVLVEERGEAATTALYRRAGGLLEAAGSAPEALRAYCRAADWEGAGRLLGAEGERLAGDPGSWVEHLPPALADSDPWLALAGARSYLAGGRLSPALAAYRHAEESFGTSVLADLCRRERLALAEWVTPGTAPATAWIRLARTATRRHPLAVMEQAEVLPGVHARLAEGIAACLAGRAGRSRELFLEVAATPGASPVVVAGAHLAAVVASLWLGGPANDDLAWVLDEAERLDIPWLVRLTRAVAALAAGRVDEAEALRQAAHDQGDRWGSGLISLFQGLAGLRADRVSATGVPTADAATDLQRAAADFNSLGAPVCEAWAEAARALVLAGRHETGAGETARRAEHLARAAGVPGALAVAYLARAITEPKRATELRGLARAADPDGEMTPPAAGLLAALSRNGATPVESPATMPEPAAGQPAPPPAVLRCLGGFALTIDGRGVDLTGVRPRARAALRLLAMRAGRAVHREALIDALWPESDAEAGAHNLQVVVSALRRLLEPDAPRGASSFVLREGDAYRLALPDGADIDVVAFEAAVIDARTARAAGDRLEAVAHLERAQRRYAGELLPEDGPVEWVVKERERLRLAAAEVAQARAELALEDGDPEQAAEACEWGLTVDRYHDPLWRLLAEARERAGDVAAAHRARRAYDETLAELGLPQMVGASDRKDG